MLGKGGVHGKGAWMVKEACVAKGVRMVKGACVVKVSIHGRKRGVHGKGAVW